MLILRLALVAAASISLIACTRADDGAATSTDDITASCKLATPKDTYCTAEFVPVCGCDGKTYGNACEAARVVTGSTPGACEEQDAGTTCKLATPKSTFCTAEVDPVCGCDGETYNNACEAARVVTSSTPGACSEN